MTTRTRPSPFLPEASSAAQAALDAIYKTWQGMDARPAYGDFAELTADELARRRSLPPYNDETPF